MMKIFKNCYFILATIIILSFALPGCNVSDSAISVNNAAPLTNGASDKTLPYVNAAPTYAQLAYSTSGTVDTTTAPWDYRVTISFSEPVLSSTVTTTNIYLRDVSSTPATITGHTISLSDDGYTVTILWSSSTDYAPAADDVPLELVVESAVTDHSGNGISGLATYYGNTYPYNTMVSDYRTALAGAGTWTNAPNWLPATVTLGYMYVDATSVTAMATFNTDDIDAATISASNFTISGGTLDTASYDESNLTAANGWVQFDITGMAENTECTVTFDPTGVAIDTTDVNRLYPDGTTVLATLADFYIFDDYDGTKGNRSSYTLPFMKQNETETIPNLPVANDYTATIDPGFSSGTDRAVLLSFTDAVDAATLIPANFIVRDAVGGDELQVDVSPFYLDGETELLNALISTLNYSQDQIVTITITHNVTCGGIHLDGDGDTRLEGGADYDQDGLPDDWVTLTGPF